MADNIEVLAGINRHPGVTYDALTPKLQRFQRALDANYSEMAIFAAASEDFSQKNINCSIAESLTRFAVLMEAAQRQNIPVRGYISCVAGCPYSGSVAPETVGWLARELLAMGCYEISLG